MIGDTVREELQANVSPRPRTVNVARQAPVITPGRIGPSAGAASAALAAAPMHEPQRRVVTSDLDVKNTNPTLVGFQNKNATMPDWRLQLQNSVRQRTGGTATASAAAATAPARVSNTEPVGAAAVKTLEAVPASPKSSDDKLAAALRRIEESRQKFSLDDKPRSAPPQEPAAPVVANRNYPFNVVARTEESPLTAAPELKASVNVLPKPRLVSSLRVGKEVFDTNKLPPLPVPAKVSTSFEKPFTSLAEERSEPVSDEVIHIARIEEETVAEPIIDAPEEAVAEIEDLAPFAVRFNAGFFDLIIGAFASLLLLSPFVLMGSGNWFTWSGLSAFLATSAVVMFIYLTTCLALFGKTFGMRIFSLELVDVEESDYPSFHQAALHSTIYLISLAFGGVGFLTILFNEEKRAVHDLLSGTIVVKEF